MVRTRGPSVHRELLIKSREAALNAVQTFNNPLTTFKTETFIVLMVIAWTYLLHAYYRRAGVEYRYYSKGPERRKFDKINSRAFKYWELERCLNEETCPLDSPTKFNLRFLIGLRHEIEHHQSAGTDKRFSGRYLACCLNYERYILELFGSKYSLADNAAFTLQFRDLIAPQDPDEPSIALPSNIARYIQEFESSLAETDFQSPFFSYRTFFVRKLVNHRGQADRAIEFIGADSDLAKAIGSQYWVLKAVEKPKFTATEIVNMMKAEGCSEFRLPQHTRLWQEQAGKDPAKGYGCELGGRWFWYDSWISVVRKHCSDTYDEYKPSSDDLVA